MNRHPALSGLVALSGIFGWGWFALAEAVHVAVWKAWSCYQWATLTPEQYAFWKRLTDWAAS